MKNILNSPLKPKIDRLLLEGKTVYEMELWCRKNGLNVSATTIKRYAETYLPEWQGNKKLAVIPEIKSSESTKNASDSPKEKSFEIKLPKVESAQQLNEIISENLKESIVNLVTIVNAKIGEYAVGDSHLPKDDLGALEKLVGIFNTITGKRNEDRCGANLFDLDEALTQGEKRESSAGQNLKDYLSSLNVETEE